MRHFNSTFMQPVHRGRFFSCVFLLSMVLCIFGILQNTIVVYAEDNSSQVTLEDIEAARQALAAAEQAREENDLCIDQGSLGFVNWMLEKTDLTTVQRYDLTQAKSVLESALSESFVTLGVDSTAAGLPASRNDMVTVIGDEKDAISLSNMRKAFTELHLVNTYRSSDDNYTGSVQRNQASTNFYFMAMAQTGADRAVGTGYTRSLTVACENLAFQISPVNVWYGEKEAFNSAKELLGIETISDENDLTRIRRNQDENNYSYDGYMNLFYTVDQIMGIGISSYKNTACFDAGVTASYSTRYAVYTVENMEELFNEYYAAVDPAVYQKAVDDAQDALDALLNVYQSECTTHTFGEGVVTQVTCMQAGYTEYTCSRCGYRLITDYVEAPGHDLVDGVCRTCGKTTPITMSRVLFYIGSTKNYNAYQTYEVGTTLKLTIDFTTASASKSRDSFAITFGNPELVGYTATNSYTGNLYLESVGETTVTITSVDNPALSLTYTIDITEAGGHHYALTPAETNTGTAAKVCSVCGHRSTFTVPKSITYFTTVENSRNVSYRSGAVISFTESLEEQTMDITIVYSPSSVDNNEFTVESSDPEAVEYTASTGNTGTLHVKKGGTVTLTVYPTYNPTVQAVYTVKTPHAEVTVKGRTATCTRTGLTDGSYCSFCGATIKEQTEIPKKDHVLNQLVTKEATCTEKGQLTYACKNCSYKTTSDIPAAGHSPKAAVIENRIEPTCKKEGSYDEVVYCGTCQKELQRDGKSIAITDHLPCAEVRENEVAATYTAEGSYDTVIYCEECGDELSRENISISRLKLTTPVIDKAVNASTGVKIYWTSVEGAEKYLIYCNSVCIAEVAAAEGTLTYVAKEANVSGTKYSFKVKAAAGTNISSASAAKNIYFIKRTAITGFENTSKGIRLTWKLTDKASGYYIYRGSELIKTITSGDTVSYVDTGAATNNTKYSYKVYPYYKTAAGTIFKSAAPTAKSHYFYKMPEITSLTSTTTGKMTVNWSKNSKATGYEIRYSLKSDLSEAKTVKVSDAGTVEKVISKLTSGKKYYVQVRVYKTISDVTYYSAWAAKKAVTVK